MDAHTQQRARLRAAEIRADSRTLYAHDPATLAEALRKADELEEHFGLEPAAAPPAHVRAPGESREAFWRRQLAQARRETAVDVDDWLDWPHRRSAAGPAMTMRALMDACRREGLCTGLSDDWYRELSGRLALARAQTAGLGLDPATTSPRTLVWTASAQGVDAGTGAPLASTSVPASATLSISVPDAPTNPSTTAFGVSQAYAVPPNAKDIYHDSGKVDLYGDALDLMADLERTGVGIVRRFKYSDLSWWALKPAEPSTSLFFSAGVPAIGDTVVPPDQMAGALDPADELVWGRFQAMCLLSYFTGVRLSPTLFDEGGGGFLNEAQDDTEYVAGTNVTFGDLKGAYNVPTALGAMLIPSSAGWAEYYWNDDDTGAVQSWTTSSGAIISLSETPDGTAVAFPDSATLDGDSAFGTATDDEKASARGYAKWALDVYADPLSAEYGGYYAECARRKAIGLAAFGEAVAKYLVKMKYVLAHGDHGAIPLTDVIADLELSNEIDSYYEVESTEGATGYATFFCALAVPIATVLPELPIRVGELVSYLPSTDPDHWSKHCTWLGTVLSRIEFVKAELGARRSLLERVGDVTGEYEDTATYGWGFGEYQAYSLYTAGFVFPAREGPLDLSTRYPQQIGYHVFQCYDRAVDKRGVDGGYGAYLTASALANDFEKFRSGASRDNRFLITLSAIGFPAAVASSTALTGPYYSAPSGPLQAAMLVRYFVLYRALGAASVSWYTWMADVSDLTSEWNRYTSMGLLADVVGSGSGSDGSWDAGSKAAFTWKADAWRRHTWFALQRVRSLLDNARSLTIETLTDELTVIDLDFGRRLRAFDLWGPPLREMHQYSHAKVIWLDQTSGSASVSDSVKTDFLHGIPMYDELPLLPELTYHEGAKGRAQLDVQAAWRALGLTSDRTDGVVGFDYTVAPASGASVSSASPLCVLYEPPRGTT